MILPYPVQVLKFLLDLIPPNEHELQDKQTGLYFVYTPGSSFMTTCMRTLPALADKHRRNMVTRVKYRLLSKSNLIFDLKKGTCDWLVKLSDSRNWGNYIEL